METGNQSSTRMRLQQFVGLASLVAVALGQCTGSLTCPSGTYGQGPFGDPSGPIVLEGSESYTCDAATGKLIIDGMAVPSKLSSHGCVVVPAQTYDTCIFEMDSVMYFTLSVPAVFKCPDGAKTLWKPNGVGGIELSSFSCLVDGFGAMLLTYANGTLSRQDGIPEFECVPQPTTTSTTTARPTTTTKKPDSAATGSQLWSVNYYYNYGVGVHAFCADQACINVIQSNGIGYDMVNGKGLLGRAVSESMINSVRASCPTGSANLRNLGFTKSGNKYLHNLSGTGLKCGWVAISNGACGARVQIKRWKSRYTDDMMYGVDLEWNTWYQGMVQDEGKVQFYMWE